MPAVRSWEQYSLSVTSKLPAMQYFRFMSDAVVGLCSAVGSVNDDWELGFAVVAMRELEAASLDRDTLAKHTSLRAQRMLWNQVQAHIKLLLEDVDTFRATYNTGNRCYDLFLDNGSPVEIEIIGLASDVLFM